MAKLCNFSKYVARYLQCRQLATIVSATNVKNNYPYIIRRATRDDFQQIQKFLWKSFYPHEPVTSVANIEEDSLNTKYMNKYAEKMLLHGFSYIAKLKIQPERKDPIMGVAVNRVTYANQANEVEESLADIKDSNLQNYLSFFNNVQREPDLFTKYKADKIFEITFLGIDQSARKQGLGLKLLKASQDLGFDCGFKVVRVDATSLFTALMCEKLRYHLDYQLSYDTPHHYGVPLLDIKPPHDALRVYTKILNE